MSSALSQVQISAHRTTPGCVEITWFFVPEPLRDQGLGRQAYDAFEAALPENISYIHLFAADTDGRGRSDRFWEAMGFTFSYETYEEEDEQLLGTEAFWSMHKGIRGVTAIATPREEWREDALND